MEEILTSQDADVIGLINLSDYLKLEKFWNPNKLFHFVLLWLINKDWHLFGQVLEYYAIKASQGQHTELHTVADLAPKGGPLIASVQTDSLGPEF